MQDELLRLQAELHKTIMFISHDIQEALKIGDRVAVMKDGYIVQTGTPEDLLTNPADDYIRAFTQDVNRAQVLKTGSITRQTIPVILGQDSVKAAWEQMQQHDLRQMYVVNRNAQPVGIVQKLSLKQAIQDGCDDIGTVMNRDFPQVRASTSLEEIFHLCQHDLPIAVTNQEGKFKGVVEQSDVLASIGRLTAEASASSVTAAMTEPLAS
jgi:glycine betaine/proline transport system ATP-binding protein